MPTQERALDPAFSNAAASAPAVPLHVLTAARRRSWFNFREVWEFRELLGFLIWRDLKVRYRQTVLGAAWAVIQPLIAMAVFSLIFGVVAGLPSDDVPYPVFTYAALLPWMLFSTVLTRMSASVVGNSGLVSKIYFPRVLIPLSTIGSALVDFVIQLAILGLMMFAYGLPITARLLALPALTILALGAATGMGLWLAALNVKYRDVNYVVPFFVQVWQFVSPVAYSTAIVAGSWQWVYGLNPLVGVIDGFRWALLGTPWPSGQLVAVSAVVVLAAVTASFVYFHRTERTFADIV